MNNEATFLIEDEIPENSIISTHRALLNDSHPLHWHNCIEMEFITGGTGEHIHNGIISPLKQGSAFLMRTTDYHAFQNADNLEVLNISFREEAISSDMLTTINSIPHNIVCNLSEADYNRMIALYNCCVDENDDLNTDDTIICNLLECILLYFMRLLTLSEQNPIIKKSRSMREALSYMHGHFRENPDLTLISKISHYSPTHFSRTFHKEFGRSYSDYLNELKTAYAKQLLSTTELKIIDVGFQSGFNSYNNFYATFKKYTGRSPADYRAARSFISESSLSWRFAMIDTDINTNPAYVYIRLKGLKPNTAYSFSYCYSYDFKIHPHSLRFCNEEEAPISDFEEHPIADKKRTHRVSTEFTTKAGGNHLITLIMGKGLNNLNCIFRYTSLSYLSLTEVNVKNAPNLAIDYSHAMGDVTWSDNSGAYAAHIDK